jgi:hypothetical protein
MGPGPGLSQRLPLPDVLVLFNLTFQIGRRSLD